MKTSMPKFNVKDRGISPQRAASPIWWNNENT